MTDNLIHKMNHPESEPKESDPAKLPTMAHPLPAKPVGLGCIKKANATQQVPTPIYGKKNQRKARAIPLPRSGSQVLVDRIDKLIAKKKKIRHLNGRAGSRGDSAES